MDSAAPGAGPFPGGRRAGLELQLGAGDHGGTKPCQTRPGKCNAIHELTSPAKQGRGGIARKDRVEGTKERLLSRGKRREEGGDGERGGGVERWQEDKKVRPRPR